MSSNESHQDSSFFVQNGLVIICAIVSIVVCSFSINAATNDYRKSTANIYRYHQQLQTGTYQSRNARVQLNNGRMDQTVSYQQPVE